MKNLIRLRQSFFYRLILLSFVLYIESGLAYVGEITSLQGQVRSQQQPLEKGAKINAPDLIETLNQSVVEILLTDETRIILGANTKLKLEKVQHQEMVRKDHFILLRGKLRVHMKRKRRLGEEIIYSTAMNQFNIFSTDFIIQTYEIESTPSTDALVLKGNIEVSGAGFEPFSLKTGEYFNSQVLVLKGKQSLMKLNDFGIEHFEKIDLENSAHQNFFPPLYDAHSSSLKPIVFQNPTSHTLSAKESDRGQTKQVPTRRLPLKRVVRTSPPPKSVDYTHERYNYDVEREPQDIQEVLVNRRINLEKNRCFGFRYERIRVLNKYTDKRIRFERKCDEFQYHL
ncbi:MAG: hypothetical protein CME63_06925 [Halobacteriovoraceae bacterium]|nr:hypothetical protein [Halobacteriovoraceae bacterium]MBC97464.1 hypothetical protein [Halobacteriovoraceae bacterium]|tara:strand:+ start:91927 stop:92949 length:1023 start_codon:yes stop_codon:yes gene_type:complete